MRLQADLIRAELPERTVIGREVLVFEETDSTNDLAARAGDDGLAEGLVIFAESQRAGRGTSGRKWISPPHRNLLFSVLLRPGQVPVSRWPELTFCAALAVAEAAEALTGVVARIKWPNDVLLGGRKVAGILVESYQRRGPGFVVVGLCLNVLQKEEDFDPEIRQRAGSLGMAAEMAGKGAEVPDRSRVAGRVLECLGTLYAKWPNHFPALMAACEDRGCSLPGTPAE